MKVVEEFDVLMNGVRAMERRMKAPLQDIMHGYFWLKTLVRVPTRRGRKLRRASLQGIAKRTLRRTVYSNAYISAASIELTQDPPAGMIGAPVN